MGLLHPSLPGKQKIRLKTHLSQERLTPAAVVATRPAQGMAALRPLILACFARMGASRHESYGNDITPPSCSVAKVLPPRVSGVKSFTTSLRSGNVPLSVLLEPVLLSQIEFDTRFCLVL